jgi:hypothetical protein
MKERGVCAFAHDAAKSGHQIGSSGTQFVVMMKRQFSEDLLSLRSECKQDLAAIVFGAGAMDKTSSFQAIYKFDCAMVADLHAVRQFANSRPHPGRHALDGQHQLILATFQTRVLHHLLAEVKEAADLVTELRQRLIVGQGKLLHAADCIVQRSSSTSYDIVRRYRMAPWDPCAQQ